MACYAVTKCVAGRRPLLLEKGAAELVLTSFDFLRHSGDLRVLAFCVMPDHYHLLAFIVGDRSLSDIMKSLGKFTARRLNVLFGRSGQFWQEGFHDHRCRDDDDIEDRSVYIEHNPERAGLVAAASEWLYSSAHPSRKMMLDRQWYAEVR